MAHNDTPDPTRLLASIAQLEDLTQVDRKAQLLFARFNPGPESWSETSGRRREMYLRSARRLIALAAR